VLTAPLSAYLPLHRQTIFAERGITQCGDTKLSNEIKAKPNRKKMVSQIDYAEFLPFPIAPIMLHPTMLIAEGRVFRAVLTLAFFSGLALANLFRRNW